MQPMPAIYGFNKCTDIGDNIFAPSIFLRGCNLRCPYCMNAPLVNDFVDRVVELNAVKDYIMDKKHSWVMISGGEPTCTKRNLLIDLLKEIKSWNCKIGLSTNGTQSQKLREILPYINYVALDIKSDDYNNVGGKLLFPDVLVSKSLLKDKKNKDKDFNYEVRTTLYPPLVNIQTITKIGGILSKEERWILQQFRHNKNMLDQNASFVAPYRQSQLLRILEEARKYCNAYLREV